MHNNPPPSWMDKYTSGLRVSDAPARAAYSAYYCVDGHADEDPEVEERVVPATPLLRPYASRTGTKTTLANMRELGWSILVSAAGVLRTEGLPWALDNGAWSAFQQGKPFDEDAFSRAIDKVGEGAQWIVLPDIVAGGLASLELSLRWLNRLQPGSPSRLLIAVQDGMTPDDVREYLNPMVGIFLGGSTQWKLATMDAWGQLARRRNCYYHVGRVNSLKRINACAQAGADSFDGTSAIAFPSTIFSLNQGVLTGQHQHSLFNPRTKDLTEIEYDCGWR